MKDAIYHEHEEQEYQEHLANEGDQSWNQHPDGCYYCGSSAHHSQDCPIQGEFNETF